MPRLTFLSFKTIVATTDETIEAMASVNAEKVVAADLIGAIAPLDLTAIDGMAADSIGIDETATIETAVIVVEVVALIDMSVAEVAAVIDTKDAEDMKEVTGDPRNERVSKKCRLYLFQMFAMRPIVHSI